MMDGQERNRVLDQKRNAEQKVQKYLSAMRRLRKGSAKWQKQKASYDKWIGRLNTYNAKLEDRKEDQDAAVNESTD